jgi:hypothetical protein
MPHHQFSEIHCSPAVVLRFSSAASKTFLSSPLRNFSSPDLLAGNSKTLPTSLTNSLPFPVLYITETHAVFESEQPASPTRK